MAATFTYSGDWLQNQGSLNFSKGTLTLGTYATGGVSVTPANLGLGAFVGIPHFVANAAGYLVEYDSTNSKVLAYRSGAVTATGTVAAPTFTGAAASLTATSSAPTITATGTHDGSRSLTLTAGNAISLSTDATQAGITGIQAPTITPGAYTPAGTNSAPTFTGSAVSAAAFSEVANGVDLSAVTIHWTATGR